MKKHAQVRTQNKGILLEQGVGVILIDHNLTGIWMNQRINGAKDHRGFHQVAGGNVDPGETTRKAAVRELWEETGIVVREEALTQVIRGIYQKPDGKEYESTQYAVITSATPEDVEPHKHTPWELVPWREIQKKRCFGAIKDIFRTR